MEDSKALLDKVIVRLAQTQDEIEAAQRLRYQVFYEEYGANPDESMAETRLDIDRYDSYADHLIVIKQSDDGDEIVGTYRLLRQAVANQHGGFYSSTEYDLDQLLDARQNLLELGRSCVLPEYRTRPVLQLLWQGIADYITDHRIDLMFGCASLHSTDIASIAQPLSYLHHYHLAPKELRVRALKGRYINMDIVPEEDLDRRKVFNYLPPLIKGYIRLGAVIGDGAVIDEQFNTTDVFIIVQTHNVKKKYIKHYERKIQRTIHQSSATETENTAA